MGGLAAAPTAAELNVPVAARVVSFLQPAPTGVTTVAILYSPDSPASISEAGTIERAMAGGVSAGRATIRTKRVTADTLGSLAGYRAAFVTAGLKAAYPGIAQAATRASVVTIGSDQSCVQSGGCIVGITGGARVQIIVNRAAARAAKVKFGSAFLMLVKEI